MMKHDNIEDSMTTDEYIAGCKRQAELMENGDQSGLSLIERMMPWFDLQQALLMKAEYLILKEKNDNR